jgi:hypothetical protein
MIDQVPFYEPANQPILLNRSGIYHKLSLLGKQNPKNLFQEVVDEIIFRAIKPRDRLILELKPEAE